MATKLGPSESRTNGALHQLKWNSWEKNVGYFFWSTKKWINNRRTWSNFHSRIHISVQKKLAATYKLKETSQTTKPNAPLRPQRKTVKGETSKEIAEERKRPLSLSLQRKMKILCIKNHLRWHKFVKHKSSALIK